MRLTPALPPAARAALARTLADNVLDAARPLPAAVVCDDRDVAAWATARGTPVVWAPGRGLDGAVAEGVRALGARGARRVVVAHGDLPLATDLAWVAEFDGVTLVPDGDDDGTNVVCVPTWAPFAFSYGRGSFARHAAAARHLGLPLRVARERRLGYDLDAPGDLELVASAVGRRRR